MSGVRKSVAQWFPRVASGVFFWTVVASIIAMFALSWPGLQQLQPGKKGTVLDLITYWLDPLLLHVLGVLCAGCLVWYGTPSTPSQKRKRAAFSVCVPCLALVFAYALGSVVLKPSFAYERPVQHLVSPWLTGVLKVDEPGVADSCPSGFVVRQAFLLMLGVAFYRRFRNGGERAAQVTWAERSALGLLVVLVLLVAFSRVYRGFHSVFDVAIALGVSCYLFWFFYYVVAAFLRRLPTDATSGITAASCILIPTFLYYSQDAHWWALIGISVFWVIAITNMLAGNEAEGGRPWAS